MKDKAKKNIYYFKCIECGRKIGVYCKWPKDIEIPKELKKQLAVHNKEIYLEGLCRKCEVSKLTRDVTVFKKLVIEGISGKEINIKALFNFMKDYVFIVDLKGKILHVNDVVLKRTGYSREELLGQSVLKVHPAELHEECSVILAGILEGTLDTCPIPILTKDGKQIPVKTKVEKIKWEGRDAFFGISRERYRDQNGRKICDSY